MTKALRDWAPGLKAEREMEIPLRNAMEADKAVVDYVLCGFAAEGHCLAKRLHTFLEGFEPCAGDLAPYLDAVQHLGE